MGAITQAMAQECARGVEVRLGIGAERVIVEGGRAEASRSRMARSWRRSASSPTSIRACCSSGFAPARRRRFPHADCRLGGSGTFRMNVALTGFDFRALPGFNAQPHHSSGIIVAPSLDYMERAYFRRAHRRLVEGADRRGADTVDGRLDARAGRTARRKPLLSARESGHRQR
jgi:phytoene dehydrogenase-like protein